MAEKMKIHKSGRVCSRCHKHLPWSSFRRDVNGPNGRESYCRECQSKRQQSSERSVWVLKEDHRAANELLRYLQRNGLQSIACRRPPSLKKRGLCLRVVLAIAIRNLHDQVFRPKRGR